MAYRSINPASRWSGDLDVARKPLAIRTLDYKRTANPVDRGLIDRVRAEFGEMPGLSPTLNQAARLFNLPQADCDRILAVLIKEGFLRHGPDGRYRLTVQH
jgi:hypothetical protein